MKLKHTLFFFFLGLIGFVSGAHGGSTFLTYCSENKITVVNPALTNSTTNMKVTHQNVYEQLFRIIMSPEGRAITKTGLLEKEPTISKDGLTYTMNLRKNAWFQKRGGFKPTRPLNAKDVVFTFERYSKRPTHFNPHPLRDVGQMVKEDGSHVKTYWDIKKLDDLIVKMRTFSGDPFKLELKLSHASASLPAILAMAAFSIHSYEYYEYLDSAGTLDKFDSEPIGTGPYLVQTHDPNKGVLTLTANPEHLEAPKFDTVNIIPKLDSKKRFESVKSGKCDIASDPLVSDFEALKTSTASDQFGFQSTTAINIGFLAMNVESDHFKGKTMLRQAISVGLDRQKYVDDTYLSQGSPAISMTERTFLNQETYKPSPLLSYNPELAQNLFNQHCEKHFCKGDVEVDLLYMPISRPYNLNGARMAELMVDDLNQIRGLKVRAVTIGLNDKGEAVRLAGTDNATVGKANWAAYLRYIKTGKYELAQLGDNALSTNAEDRFANSLTSGIGVSNYSRFSNPDFEAVYKKASQELNEGRLKKLYQDAEEILAREMPYAPVLNANIFRIYRKDKVRKGSYKLDPLHIERFAELIPATKK